MSATNLTIQEKVLAFLFELSEEEAKQNLEELLVKGVSPNSFKQIKDGTHGAILVETPASQLLECVYSFYRSRHEILTKNIVLTELEGSGVFESLQVLFLKLETFKPEQKEFSYFLERLDETNLETSLRVSILDAVSLLEKDKVQETFKLIKNRILEIEELRPKRVKTQSLRELADGAWEKYQIIKQNPNAFRGIGMGWEEFDEHTMGHLPGELVVVSARTSVGKSILLGNVAINNYEKGKNVVIASVEMPNEQIERRFSAKQTYVDADKFRKGTLTDEEEKVYFECLQVRKQVENNLFIIPQDLCQDVTSIDIELGKISKEHKIDLILVDYLQIVEPSIVKIGEREDITLGRVAKELRELGRHYNCPLFTATQENRDSIDKQHKSGVETIGYSDKIGHFSDAVYKLYVTEDDIQEGMVTVKVIKSRECATGETFRFKYERSKMLIAEDVNHKWME